MPATLEGGSGSETPVLGTSKSGNSKSLSSGLLSASGRTSREMRVGMSPFKTGGTVFESGSEVGKEGLKPEIERYSLVDAEGRPTTEVLDFLEIFGFENKDSASLRRVVDFTQENFIQKKEMAQERIIGSMRTFFLILILGVRQYLI
jgi:hypothetical protein